MFVYSAADIRLWDAYSIENEPIASIDLMERASEAFAHSFLDLFGTNRPVTCICGHGNNGGDGLAVARLLRHAGCSVQVFMVPHENPSKDFSINLERLQKTDIPIHSEGIGQLLNSLDPDAIIIDALFGTGNSRPLSGIYASIVQWVNELTNVVVSIDMPSGLQADHVVPDSVAVQADYTLTFQCIKTAMLMPETGDYFGQWKVLDIGLHPDFTVHHTPQAIFVTHPTNFVELKHYAAHAHKGMRGHALIGAGSVSMMGAAVMAAKAALRSGVGLVTVATDAVGWPVLQQSAPEALCAAKGALANESFQKERRIKAIGIGPGWLADDEHVQLLAWLLEEGNTSLVIDATAIGLLQDMKQTLAAAAVKNAMILTPHIGEFDRLFGLSKNHFERLQLAKEVAVKYHVYIFLKGAYTRIITPTGACYINSTGNHGMAKGGSGDVLTGLLTGLLAQGYGAKEACILAAWLHGQSGDIAAEMFTKDGMTALDIISALPEAWSTAINLETATLYESRDASW